MNKHLIIGRLGKDPEVVSTTSGKRVARFTMATSDSYKDKATGEKKEITDWHNCVLWGPAVDALEKYVKKGHLLHVEGRVSTRKWEKDGVNALDNGDDRDELRVPSVEREQSGSCTNGRGSE